MKFRSKSRFSIRILELLVYFAQQNIISAFDVYHQVLIATSNPLYESDTTIFNNENNPFLYLLELGKFRVKKNRKEDFQFLTMKNIETNFQKTIQHTDKLV